MKQTKKVLAVVLALAMVFSMSIMVSAATTADVVATSTVNEAGEVVVTVTVKAGSDLAEFDFGVAYDADQVTFKQVDWDMTFFMDYSMTKKGIAAAEAREAFEYVVFGGTAGTADGKYPVDKDTVIGTVTFTVNEGVTEPTNIGIYKDSANIMADGTAPSLKESNSEPATDIEAPVVDEPEAPESEAPADPTPSPVVPGDDETETPDGDKTETPAGDKTEAPAGDDNDDVNNNGNNNAGNNNAGNNADDNTADDNNAGNANVDDNANAGDANADDADDADDEDDADETPDDGKGAGKYKTGDATSVVVPVVAIVAAAAAVVVVSKKRVEE